MKKTVLIILASILIKASYSQTLFPYVYSSFGGFASNATVQLTWTAGEPFYETVTNSNNTLTQGFNQTVIVSQLSDINENDTYKIACFPNPTTSFVKVILQSENFTNLNLQVIDLQGKVLFSQKTVDNYTQIDFSKFANGVYLLNIFDKNQKIKSFKIQKIK